MDGLTQPKASITPLIYRLFVPGFGQTMNNKALKGYSGLGPGWDYLLF